MLVSFSLVEHLNLAYILRFLLFTADVINDIDETNASRDT